MTNLPRRQPGMHLLDWIGAVMTLFALITVFGH